MGLNSRGGGGGGDRNATARRTLPKSVLDEDDDNDDDDDDDIHNDNLNGREAVNRSIAKQQAAIRAQAAAALATTDSSIYDYDGIYDSIQHTNTTHRNSATTKDATTTDSRKSRYIEDLMKTAKVRKMERDIAFDRKVARDQRAEEEAQPEFRNKDKFITSSYQRQLEERHQYEQQESKLQQIESENDVTKRSDGVFGVASFYGNLSKVSNEDSRTDIPSSITNENMLHNHGNEKHSKQERPDRKPATTTNHPTNDEIAPTTPMRLVREQKVQAARDRYLQRHNISQLL
jgi:Coiled-coil domain-containing protein 55 (DUF2040)